MHEAHLLASDHQLPCHVIMLGITDQESDIIRAIAPHKQALGLAKPNPQYFLLLEKFCLFLELRDFLISLAHLNLLSFLQGSLILIIVNFKQLVDGVRERSLLVRGLNELFGDLAVDSLAIGEVRTEECVLGLTLLFGGIVLLSLLGFCFAHIP